MESWSVGFDGDADVERHANVAPHVGQGPSPDTGGRREVGQGPSPDLGGLSAIRLRVVSDYICPWCYIGLVRVEQLANDFTVELDTCAYELRPGIPPEGIARDQLAPGRTYPPGYLENLRQTALDAGIQMKRPALVPNTIKAHEATEFAREHGLLHPVHRALFRAYFELEQNIGDIDVLTEIGAEVGLDADQLRRALEEGRYTAEVQRQIEWARSAGVTGVPTAVFSAGGTSVSGGNGGFAVVGAQDYAVYRDVASRVAAGRLQSDDSHA